MADQEYKEKKTIIEAMLPHIPTLGWTREAAHRGAQDANIDLWHVDRLFMGIDEMIDVWHTMASDHMRHQWPAEELESLKIRQRIEVLVMSRLEYFAPHKAALKTSLRYMTQRAYKGYPMRLLAKTSDDIWHHAGDRSVDFNYYTKRGLLGAVYTATMTKWILSESSSPESVRPFLHDRISNVLSIGKGIHSLKTTFQSFTGCST